MEHDILDPSKSGSVVNMVPELLRRRIDSVPADFWELTEDELVRFTKSGRFTEIDSKLRITFWAEYNRAFDAGTMMRVSGIVTGVCTTHTFYNRVTTDPARLVFIMTPPLNYKVELEDTLNVLIKKLRQIADLPVSDDDGNPNYKNIDLILKTFPHIDNRVKGGVVQRVEQKTVTMQLPAGREPTGSVSDIDKRLAELEQKSKDVEAKSLPAAPQEVVIGAIAVPMGEGDEPESI